MIANQQIFIFESLKLKVPHKAQEANTEQAGKPLNESKQFTTWLAENIYIAYILYAVQYDYSITVFMRIFAFLTIGTVAVSQSFWRTTCSCQEFVNWTTRKMSLCQPFVCKNKQFVLQFCLLHRQCFIFYEQQIRNLVFQPIQHFMTLFFKVSIDL